MYRYEFKGGIWGLRSIKWKMIRVCFCVVGNEVDEGEFGARININIRVMLRSYEGIRFRL